MTGDRKQIPIDEITTENLPSDEELEAMGDLKPINATWEEVCDKIFPEDRKFKKDKEK